MPNPASAGLPHAAQYITDGTVTEDRVTGLSWQAQPPQQDYKWADAAAACEGAATGGFHDWRLPTRIELISIVDFTTKEPALDEQAFPNAALDLYWTATPSASAVNSYEAVDFEIGYGFADNAGELHYVRCVRGLPSAAPPHYTAHNGYVTDNATGLNWEMPAPPGDADYATTLARCQNLLAGGVVGWRLPSIKELQTLVDVTKYDPAIDTTVFTDSGSDVEMFWSSSSDLVLDNQDLHWLLQSDTGVPPADTPDGLHRSRCVF